MSGQEEPEVNKQEDMNMFMPSVFSDGDDVMNEMMNEWGNDWNKSFFGKHNPLFGKRARNLMKTDVKETDNSYELEVDLPGFKKDEVKLQLSDGYLTISAEKGLNKDEEKHGRLIRQERYEGAMQRSFYVGDGLTEDDVKASFTNGVLKISLPKAEAKKALPEESYIEIEG
jgi:HSP20 family protein